MTLHTSPQASTVNRATSHRHPFTAMRATQRRLFHGGYIFVHRSLQEHFAAFKVRRTSEVRRTSRRTSTVDGSNDV